MYWQITLWRAQGGCWTVSEEARPCSSKRRQPWPLIRTLPPNQSQGGMQEHSTTYMAKNSGAPKGLRNRQARRTGLVNLLYWLVGDPGDPTRGRTMLFAQLLVRRWVVWPSAIPPRILRF